MAAPATAPEKKSIIQEFRDFVTTGDLMTIAVAFIMGAAVKQLIDSFVNDVMIGLIGLMVPCKDVLDETPAAYKDIDAVMAAQRDLVEVVHTLKQVVCVKG